jgi:hypothetical protein
MKQAAKIIKTISLLITSAIIILFALSLILQNKVADLLLKSLNNTFSTRIETESYRLSLIRKFPKASIELKNVLVHSSPDFDCDAFKGISTDTLLAAKSASIDFRTFDILRGTYTFTRINIKSGMLKLYTDTSGRYNYNISGNKAVPDKTDNVSLNFNTVNLSDVGFVYNDLRVELIVEGIFNDASIRSKIRNRNIEFDANAKLVFNHFQLGNISLGQSIPADLEVGMNNNDKGTFFKKSTMRIENWDFILNGFVASDNYFDLNITADKIDISRIIKLIPEKYSKALSSYDPAGNLKFNWIAKGKSTRYENPHQEASFSIRDAKINHRKSDLKVEGLSFEGAFTNGEKNRPETSTFRINDFVTRFGSSDFKGSFSITDFTDPKTELVFRGKLLPAEIREFLNLRNIDNARGSIDLDLMFSGKPEKKDSYKFADVFTLNSHSEVVFNSVGMEFNNRKLDLRDVTGRIFINESAKTDNFRLLLNNQLISFSGTFHNLPGWLAGNQVNLAGSATLSASSFRPELFMAQSGNVNNEDTDIKAPIIFPSYVNLDINYRIDTLSYKAFYARDISGTLAVRPKIMNFQSFTMNSQEGLVKGNGLIVQNPDKTFVGRGSYAVAGVNVNKSFITFNNFGQDFLKAENLAGSLSGNISLVIQVDSLLNPDLGSVVAEGKFIITEGALINFDPVKALSSFIELSELEKIKFEKLENEFFIRNNIFYLPAMDIKSSAANLTVNGEHSFDNKYQYHVKMLLSEILSKKARKRRTYAEEFGEVQDDGLGRTSVFLKIDGLGDEVKVSYDMKAAGNRIKEDLNREKQTLKTIIREEYGLYEENSVLEVKESSRPRFRISWEGSDTTSVEEQAPVPAKDNIFEKLDRLFKRRNNTF